MVSSRTGGTRSLACLAALCALALGPLQHDLVQAADSSTTPDVACQLAIADTAAPSSSTEPAQSAASVAAAASTPSGSTSSAPDEATTPSQASTGSGYAPGSTGSAPAAASVFAACRSTVSEGDRAVGIQVITDQSCATSSGTGCFDSVCRYCQVAPTAQSTQYNKCSDYGYFFVYTASTTSTTSAVATSTCTATITDAEAAAGVWLVSDLTCASGGTGCSGTTCRYCQTRSTPQSQSLLQCSDFGYSTSTAAVSTASTSGSSHSTDGRSTTGSSATGSSVSGTDAKTAAVSTASTSGSSHSTDGTSTTGSSVSGTDANDDGNGDDFFWPEAPSGSFSDGSSSNPFGQTDAVASCTLTVASGDAAVGLQIVTDSSCASGGLGCINSLCRFCKYFESAQSPAYVTCTSLGFYFATPAPAITTATLVTTTATPVTTTATPVSTTATPTTTTSAPAIVLTCSQTVSSGDAAVGIQIVTDISCFDGGVGCLNNVCRYCKCQSTVQSAGFVDCSSIDTTLGNDITFVALPVFTTTTPTPTPTTPTPTTPTPTTSTPTTPTPTTAACSVSSGDASVGLSAYADATCASGGLGCYSGTCRFCRMWTTTQSQAYYVCPTAQRLLSEVNEVADTPKKSRFFSLATIGAGGFCVVGLVAMMAFAVKARLKRRARTDIVQVDGSSHQVMAGAVPSSDEDDDEDDDVRAAVTDSAMLATDI